MDLSDYLGFLLTRDGLTWTLAGTGVRMSALAADRKAPTVTDSLVGTDLDLATNVALYLAAEVTFGLEVRVDVVAKLDQVSFCNIADSLVGVYASGFKRLA